MLTIEQSTKILHLGLRARTAARECIRVEYEHAFGEKSIDDLSAAWKAEGETWLAFIDYVVSLERKP